MWTNRIDCLLIFLQTKPQHFLEVFMQLIQRRSLAVRASDSRNKTNVQVGLGIEFDISSKRSHDIPFIEVDTHTPLKPAPSNIPYLKPAQHSIT